MKKKYKPQHPNKLQALDIQNRRRLKRQSEIGMAESDFSERMASGDSFARSGRLEAPIDPPVYNEDEDNW